MTDNIEPIQHNDSETLMKVYTNLGITSYSFGNTMSGLGTTRDPGSYNEIINPYILNEQERNNLFRSSRIAKNIVSVYPMEASWGTFTFGNDKYKKYSSLSQKAADFFDDLKTGTLHEKFIESTIEARLHGEAYLLLGCEDGQNYDKPLNEDNIETFEWVYMIPGERVKPADKRPGWFEITLKNDLNAPKDKDILLVHESRLCLFIGDYLPASVRQKKNKHDSVLQGAFDGLSLALSSLSYGEAMLKDSSIFTYKLEGLANLVRQKKMDEIYSRFLALQMSKSVIRGIAIDMKTESAEFTERNFSNVDKIIQLMIDFMVAESGMVRYKILGASQDKGLGAEGRGLQERLQHSLNVRSFQEFTWRKNLKRILTLGCKTKTGFSKGKVPTRGVGIIFPPVLELSPNEIVDIQHKSIEMGNMAIDSGILSPLEVRFALFNTNETVIIPNFTLDDRFTEQMEEELFGDNSDTVIVERSPESLEEGEEDVTDQVLERVIGDEDEDIGDVEDIERVIRNDTGYLVWFAGRRTAIAVNADSPSEAVSKARKKKKRGGEKVQTVRKATAAENKTAASGRWIRTGPKGEPAGYNKSKRGYGPKPTADEDDTRDFTITASLLDKVGDYLENSSDISEETIDELFSGLTER